jgi:hypothetical protein
MSQWWGDERAHWGDYGAEQAAETIVWGVIDRPISASQIPAPYNDCGHLWDAYVMLTGRPAPPPSLTPSGQVQDDGDRLTHLREHGAADVAANADDAARRHSADVLALGRGHSVEPVHFVGLEDDFRVEPTNGGR